MQEVYDFLKQAGTWFLATSEDGQPQIRPFHALGLYQGRLYFLTERGAAVSRRLHENPRLAICAVLGSSWLQLEAAAAEDNDRALRAGLLESCPALRNAPAFEDGGAEFWYLRKVTAVFSSPEEPPRIVNAP